MARQSRFDGHLLRITFLTQKWGTIRDWRYSPRCIHAVFTRGSEAVTDLREPSVSHSAILRSLC